MKRKLLISVMTGAPMLFLSACGGAAADESGLREDCLVIANDAEGQTNIAGMGTDADGFCTCALAMISEMPSDQQAQAKATMARVAEDMKAGGKSTETVTGEIIGDAMAAPDDVDAQAIVDGIPVVGRMIDRMAEGFEDTGSCPAG